jgi:hypothetical protein
LLSALPEDLVDSGQPFNTCFCMSSTEAVYKLKVLLAIAAKKTVYDPAEGSADNWCDPEKPEL